MLSTIHLHSKLNGYRVSCSASTTANMWRRGGGAWFDWGCINDAYYPVHQIYTMLLNKPTSDNLITKSNWTQDEPKRVDSITATDFKDDPAESDYNVTYNFNIGITAYNVPEEYDTGWSFPRHLYCGFQINMTRTSSETDEQYVARFQNKFIDAYVDFIRSCYPGTDIYATPHLWSTRTSTGKYSPSDCFQITQATCNILFSEKAIEDDQAY